MWELKRGSGCAFSVWDDVDATGGRACTGGGGGTMNCAGAGGRSSWVVKGGSMANCVGGWEIKLGGQGTVYGQGMVYGELCRRGWEIELGNCSEPYCPRNMSGCTRRVTIWLSSCLDPDAN